MEEKSPKLQRIALFLFLSHLSANFLTIKTINEKPRCDGQKYFPFPLVYVTFLSMSCISNGFVEFPLRWNYHKYEFNHRAPRITTAYWKPNYSDLYGNLS